jgi:AraC family transcriptional regulator
MDYRIVDKPVFNVVGKAIRVATKDGENFRLIPQFWEQCQKDGTLGQLGKLAGAGSLGDVTLGICADFAPNMEEFTYMIAAENSGDSVPDGCAERTIPAAAWAVFESVGAMPDAIQNAWGKIWGEFFAAGEYVHGAAPDLEVYPPGDPMSADYRCEVWVPVVKS